jgi:hypothetical protein
MLPQQQDDHVHVVCSCRSQPLPSDMGWGQRCRPLDFRVWICLLFTNWGRPTRHLHDVQGALAPIECDKFEFQLKVFANFPLVSRHVNEHAHFGQTCLKLSITFYANVIPSHRGN